MPTLRRTCDCTSQFSASTSDDDNNLNLSSSYPLCNIPDHHPDSPTLIHDVDALSLPGSAPLYVDDNPQAVPLLGGNISVLSSSYIGHQTTTEILCKPSVSPDPAGATGGARDIDIMSPSTLEVPRSPFSVRSIDTISTQNNIALLAPSDTPEIPFSASSEPVLDNILPAGSSLSLMTESDHSPSFAESHCSISAEASPETFLWPTSPPKCDYKDAPSVNRMNRANTMAALDFPPELSSTTDKAITGPSQPEPDARNAGDRPHVLQSQYEIV